MTLWTVDLGNNSVLSAVSFGGDERPSVAWPALSFLALNPGTNPI